MQVRELKLRDGSTFTPLVHKDSVVDSSRDPLKNWIAPISVEDTDMGKSSFTNFKGSGHIVVEGVAIVDEDEVRHIDVTFTHDNKTTVYSSDGTISLVGAANIGDQQIKISGVTYNPATGILSSNLTSTNLVGGAKGSLIYQSGANTTTTLPIGTTDQILAVSDQGIPVWVSKTAGITGIDWIDGTTQGPILELSREGETPLDSDPIPAASASTSGIITTTTQTIKGNKTFADDVNLSANKVIKINNTEVLSSTQYVGNSATANKVNHTLSFSSTKEFDGSANVSIGLNDIDGVTNVSHGGTGLNTLTANTLYLGNGTSPLQPLTNGSQYETISISSSGIPAYGMLTLSNIPDITFTLYADSLLEDVPDFVV